MFCWSWSLELKRKEKCCKQGYNNINEFIELNLNSLKGFNSFCTGAGEMLAQWLQTLTAFAEDLRLAPSTHIKWLTTTSTPASGYLTASLGFCRHLDTCGTHFLSHTCMYH